MKIKLIAHKPRPDQIHPIEMYIGQVFEVAKKDEDDPRRLVLDLPEPTGIVIVNPGEYEVVEPDQPAPAAKVKKVVTPSQLCQNHLRKAAKHLEQVHREVRDNDAFNQTFAAQVITKIVSLKVDIAGIIDDFK